MNDVITGNTSMPKATTDWDALRHLSATDIHANLEADPDAHATDAAFWEGANVVLPPCKQAVTMRLDADLLAWFRQHRGYQTRINAILRTYMNAHVDRQQPR
jgi:uncharacterized protein (DUF4415 family)